MPKFRMKRQESGERYRTIEVEANTREEAEEMIWDDEGTIVFETFKQRDAEVISLEEVSENEQS